MKKLIFIAALLTLLISSGSADCSESGSGWNEAGVRLGIQAGPRHEYFHSYDAFAVYKLPYDWRSASGWGVTPQTNLSLGVLHTAARTGIIGSIGTGLAISKTGLNLMPELGICINLMDKRHFGKQDFGSILLFGAYAGLSYHFDNGLGIGYRILHLSNGHIFYSLNTPNPGVDLHQISVSWHF